jgi:TATA-binding protein-associated factor
MYTDYDKEKVNGGYLKSEADLSNVPTASTVELSSAHVKVEPEFCVDDSTDPCKGDSSCKPVHEKLSTSNPSSHMHAPENSKFMKLMKLAKYSYMKNWEFLQDCAIRFLCVLSLDRYASLDLQIYD